MLWSGALVSQDITLDWVKTFDSGYATSYAVTTDAAGNVYHCGVFSTKTDFDPGPDTLFYSPVGVSAAFVQKFGPTGNVLWTETFGTDLGVNRANSLAVDATGNVYVIGSFSESGDYDPGSGVTTLSALSLNDVFVMKLNTDGDFQWAKDFGTYNMDEGNSIVVHPSGSIFATGRITEDLTIDLVTGTTTIYTNYQYGFILKMNPDGDFLQFNYVDGFANYYAYGLEIGPTSNMYQVGGFADSLDLNGGTVGTDQVFCNGIVDAFIRKFDGSGFYLWGHAIGGQGFDGAVTVAADNSDNVFVGGYFAETVDFDPSATVNNITAVNYSDAFVIKYNAAGDLSWVKTFPATLGNFSEVKSVHSDGQGAMYATGSYNDGIDIDPGSGTAMLTGFGGDDIFLVKLNAAGDFVWGHGFGGAGDDYSRSVYVDGNYQVFLTGEFTDSVDFDPGAGTDIQVNADLFDASAYVAKYDQGITGIGATPKLAPIGVYPNPTNGLLTIDLSGTYQQGTIQILNMAGQVVYTHPQPSTGKVNLQVDLPTGAYFVKVSDNHQQSIVKVVFE